MVEGVLAHCFDGKQLVLALISRTAFADYFHLPPSTRSRVSPSLQQCNLLVESNLEAFKRIITAKFERGERGVQDQYGQSYPRVHVTLDDMQRCGEKLAAASFSRSRRWRLPFADGHRGTATAEVGSPSDLTPMPRSRLVETALI